MKMEIDRSSFAVGALAAVSLALLCNQTLTTLRPQSNSVDRVMTLIVPAQRQAASMTDPDSSSKAQNASPQADKGVCQGKAPDCWNDESQNNSGSNDGDDDSFDPPDPTDPVPA